MQVLPNVFLVNGIPYREHQNSYVVRLGDTSVMIDCGELGGDTFQKVESNAAAWGIGLDQVEYLLLTHAHFDHASNAARLQAMGAKIVTNEDGAQALAAGDDRCIGYAVNRRFEPCRADVVVKDGEELDIGGQRVSCIEAPGHANSCVIFEIVLDGRRLWFVGDVVLTGTDCQSVELGWTGGPDYDRSIYLPTLERLRRMECDCLFPGHGPPCLVQGKALLEMAYTKAMTEWR